MQASPFIPKMTSLTKYQEVLTQSRQEAAREMIIFFWIYSTKDVSPADDIEGHLLHLKSTFLNQTQELARLTNEGIQIRIWIYFGYGGYNGGINGSFVLSDEIITWISSFKGEIYIDVWS